MVEIPAFPFLPRYLWTDGTAITSGAYIGFGFRYGFDATNAFPHYPMFLKAALLATLPVRRSDKVLAIALSGDVFESIDQRLQLAMPQ